MNITPVPEPASEALEAASSRPAPFIRWAGSKRWLLPTLKKLIPGSFGSYYEPFLGSGSLYFWLEPRRAIISDTLAPLIETYVSVRDAPEAVLNQLALWKLDEATYYQVRAERYVTKVERTAQFIYLNKAGFNGLYRVNRQGTFNVPFGRPKTNTIVNPRALLASSALLADATIYCHDFADATASASKGDLVFLDPPYASPRKTPAFTEYNEKLFEWSDQVRLARRANDLARRGVHVIVTNRSDERVKTLYSHLFQMRTLSRTSTVAANPKRRGTVTELLLTANIEG